MKGGVRLISHTSTSWRVAWDFTAHNNTSWRVVWDVRSHNSTSWRVVWDFTAHTNTSRRVVWDFTAHNKTSCRVVWGFTAHNNTSWRVVWGFTAHNNTSRRVVWDVRSHNRTSWRVVWVFTAHSNTSLRVAWDFTAHNNTSRRVGGVRLYSTQQYIMTGWWCDKGNLAQAWRIPPVVHGDVTLSTNIGRHCDYHVIQTVGWHNFLRTRPNKVFLFGKLFSWDGTDDPRPACWQLISVLLGCWCCWVWQYGIWLTWIKLMHVPRPAIRHYYYQTNVTWDDMAHCWGMPSALHRWSRSSHSHVARRCG